MTLNTTKCIFMLVSRKNRPSIPSVTISLYGVPLENVTTFKYLGVLLSSGQVTYKKTCSKARQLLGLLYRRFYRHSSEETLRQLYISLVLPHLEYGSSVWSPHLQKDVAMLEKTQHFACKICTKLWDSNYYEPLDRLRVPTLANRRLHTDLCLLYKIFYGIIYFPPDIIILTVTYFTSHLHIQIPTLILLFLGLYLCGTHYLTLLYHYPLSLDFSVLYHYQRVGKLSM